jgi:hypothetical protein
MREFGDTKEMVNNQWFDLDSVDFVARMLPGDMEIIKYVQENVEKYFDNQELIEFKIEKTGVEIDSAVTELNKSIGHLK